MNNQQSYWQCRRIWWADERSQLKVAYVTVCKTLYEITHSSKHTQTVINQRTPLIHLPLHQSCKNLSWEMRISQPNSHPLITHTRTHEYTYECSAIHKGKVWSLSLAICDLIKEGPWCCLFQSICILTHSLRDMHLYQSPALNQNPSTFEVGFKKKVCFCHLCLYCCHAQYSVC